MQPPRLGLAVLLQLLATTAVAQAQICQQLSGVFSATIAGATVGVSSDSGSCGGGSAPEAYYFFTAPRSGTYVVDTLGSDFDTVLYARDGGGEIACNDDIQPGELSSRIAIPLAAGQFVTFVVDGFANGNFVLRINGNCPAAGHGDPRDLGSPTSLTLTGNTACGSYLSGGYACGDGGDNAPDSLFLYTAPLAGTYVIDTLGSSFDTILAVRSGGCAGATLQCNDDLSPQDSHSRVTLDLEAGQGISIAVDGFGSAAGSFTLHLQATPFTPTATLTRTPTRTRTASPTHTVTPTRSVTRTRTSTRTASATRTASSTRTATRTRSLTPAPSATRTPTPSSTPTATSTATPTPSRSATRTTTVTSTATATATPSPSPSPTASPSPTPSASPTRTPSPTPTPSSPPTSTASSVATHTQPSTPTASPAPTVRPPSAPVDLVCRTFFDTLGWFARLDWTDVSLDESEFHIERLDGMAPEVWTQVVSVGAGVQSVQLGPLDSGLRLDYRVRAHRHADDSYSAPSNTVECTTSAPTATPAPSTSTATPPPTHTPTPVPTTPVPPSSLCRPRRGGGFTCRIDFEVIPGGYAPVPFGDVIRDQYAPDFGVSFPAGGWVIRPRLGTSSPNFALINATSGAEQEFNSGPLRIELRGVGADRLALRVGLEQRIAGVHPVLTVFDSSGSRSLSVAGAEFAAAGTSIDQVLAAAPLDFLIARAEVLYTGDAPSARNAVETIDDVEIGVAGAPPCPAGGDSAAPIVSIDSPGDGETWSSRTLPILYGRISDDSHQLGAVTAEVQSFTERLSFDLGPYVVRDEFDASLFHFAIANIGLFDFDNDVTVYATDRACPPNRASDTVRVRVETPPPTLNLFALGIEVTQAVQDVLHTRGVVLEGGDPRLLLPLPYGTAMSLVANKLLAVRAYPGIAGASDPVRGVPAELLIRRGLVETTLVGAPITVDPGDDQLAGGVLDVEMTVRRKREDIRKGWLFLVPLSLTRAGRIDAIELHVNPPGRSGPRECLGCNDRANVLTVTNLEFHRATQLGIRVVHVRDKDTRLETEADAGPRTLCDSFLKSFPLAEGCGTHRSSGIYLTRLVKQYDSRGWLPGTDTSQKLRELACKAGATGQMGAAFYQENLVLAPAASTGVGYGTGYGGSGCSSAAEYDWPTAAQEVGHSWLLCHAPCGSPPMLCPGYPNSNGKTDDEGFHTGRFKVMPKSSLDWMSYCDNYDDIPDFNNWVSPYVFRRLQAGLSVAGGRAAAAGSAAAEPVEGEHLHLLASGSVRDSSDATLDPLYVVPSRAPEAVMEGGPYTLEQRAADGRLLSRWAFVGEHLTGEPAVESFHLEIPYDLETARVLLNRGPEQLAEVVASAAAPTLELLEPGAGDTWPAEERVAVRWRAEDADGDPLYSRVQYSTDGGETWLGIADDLTASVFELQGSDLPGAEDALIRVLVSDGLRTAVQSQSISVAFKDPLLRISGAPPDGVARPGSVVNLRAEVLDLDDQPVADEETAWRSDRLGLLGHGVELEIAAEELPPGANRIFATVPGKRQPTVSASVVLLRLPQTAEILAPCGGDCDENGSVTVDEIVAATNVATGVMSPALCATYDADLAAAVERALRGCGDGGGAF